MIRLRLRAIETYERPVVLRLPFRFGVVTLTEAPQAFLRAEIETEDGRRGWGQAAEMLAPKWFDKSPELSNEDNFEQLRGAVALAREAYLSEAQSLTAFGLHAAHDAALRGAGRKLGLNPLVMSFGSALLDRAILDALGRVAGVSVFQMTHDNLFGLDAATTPDLAELDFATFLTQLIPAESLLARHTVGLVDALTEAEIGSDQRIGDGLPESLEAALTHYGLRAFKLKVGGDLKADLERLTGIAAVLDRSKGSYLATLDGNEQYEDVEAVIELWKAMLAEPKLERLVASTEFIEQPIKRQAALARDVSKLAVLKPVEIDESDGEIGAFVEAKRLGYQGVSSKSCKGFYRSLLNRARCALWNAQEAGPFFMSAEDLTTQAGVSVQQDLALVSLIGCGHVERNGHHYVNGLAAVAEEEQSRFLAAHGDLYERSHGAVRLKIAGGRVVLGSLDTAGLGCAVEPNWDAMTRMSYRVPEAA